METNHEVVYGGLGSGKSQYVFGIVNPEETFKLGVGGLFREALLLKFGSTKRHEEDTKKASIKFKTTTLDSVVYDISKIEQPTLLLDEWTTFFSYSFWWPSKRIVSKANEILNAVERNPNLERGVYVALDYIPYLPFNLYKKKALWNKVLFERADEITKVEYGKIRKIYGND